MTHKHTWDFENSETTSKILKDRDLAMLRARLGHVMSDEGIPAATALHDKIMSDHPVPEPGRIVCVWCGAKQEVA